MKKTQQTDTPPVLKMTEATAMTQAEIVASFKAKDALSGRITVELAKLLTAFRTKLKDPSQATAILKKQGIRPGSVNTASENARVLTALVPDHLAEEVFDTLTVKEMQNINRCMSGASKKKLDAAAVADLIKLAPDEFNEELESIFATGLTIAEGDAQAALALKEAEDAAKKSEKEKADAIAAGIAATAALEALEKQTGQKAPVAGKENAIPTPSASAAKVEPPPAEVTTPKGNLTPGAAPSASHVAASVIPANVVNMPPADPDAALPATLAALDEILKTAAGMSKSAKETIGMKLMEMNDALFPTVTVKPAKKKVA